LGNEYTAHTGALQKIYQAYCDPDIAASNYTGVVDAATSILSFKIFAKGHAFCRRIDWGREFGVKTKC
jgi:hypothetical protein